MTKELSIVQRQPHEITPQETALLLGDLSKLTPAERGNLYASVCNSLGINALTGPFGYIAFRSGELKLYAKRECTDQLRQLNRVSITSIDRVDIPGCIAFKVNATDKHGRTDCSIGAVPGGNLTGEALANAIMKAETKAKRRVTLSLCGLGFPDESEIDQIKDARVVDQNFDSSKAQIEDKKNTLEEVFYYNVRGKTEAEQKEIADWVNENCGSAVDMPLPGVYCSPIALKKLSKLQMSAGEFAELKGAK